MPWGFGGGSGGGGGAAGPAGPAGPPGPTGAAEGWHSASGAPAGGLGVLGDWYLDTADGSVYEKTGASAWTLRGNIKGPTGAAGADGVDGAEGVPGPPGEVGPQGENGETGAGLQPGGLTGEVATKGTDADYDIVWTSVPDEMVVSEFDPGTATVELWYDPTAPTPAVGFLPAGGEPGQVLTKGAGADYDATWVDPFDDTTHDTAYTDHIPKFADGAERLLAIPTPVEGQLSYLEDSNAFYFWDGTQWDTLIPPTTTPPGIMAMFAGGTAPGGWLLCQGQSLAVASYVPLHTAIGYAFGGAGASFNIPDLRGRSPLGAGTGVGLTGRNLGAQNIGIENSVLQRTHMPNHAHGVGEYAITGTQRQNHNHTGWNNTEGIVTGAGPASGIGGLMAGGTLNNRATTHWEGQAHNHEIGAEGNNTPFDNMHPVSVVNFIIKF